MEINPLAAELNSTLQNSAPVVYSLLSDLGQRLYFPKGIISQSVEAKQKAKRHNATIGIATEGGQAMHLPSVNRYFSGLTPAEIFPYAPTGGNAELRKAWREKQLRENPRMRGKALGSPIVTAALTHGLTLIGDMFLNRGDTVVLPDKFWGNYTLTYRVKLGAEFEHFTLFKDGAFNSAGLHDKLQELAEKTDKAMLVLNFPNNPTGYTPSAAEAEEIAGAVQAAAEKGLRQIVLCDDAYFGLFFDEECLSESIFGYVAGSHPNVLAVRLDGATKEEFAWGFRVGFLSYGVAVEKDADAVLEALEKKTVGLIRGSISNTPNPSQSIVLRALRDKSFDAERAEKKAVLQGRATRVREVLERPEFAEAWTPYPFNSGYFMCVKIKDIDAEALRVHLLDKYGVGVISSGKTDIRVAFSCLEEEHVPEVFEALYNAWKDLKNA